MDEMDAVDLDELLGYETHDWYEDCNDDESTEVRVGGSRMHASGDYWYLPEDAHFRRIEDTAQIKGIIRTVEESLPVGILPEEKLPGMMRGSSRHRQTTLDA